MPAITLVSWRMPSGWGSPTGRIPQERSRLPPQVSGVTAMSSPPTVSVPSQRPFWAKRWVSNTTDPRLRMYWRGSSNAGCEPVQVRSMATSASLGSTTTRSFRSGSMISIRNGPTEMSIRSTSGLLVRMIRWVPSLVTARKASVVPRLGYWPRPKMANHSSEEGWALK